MIKTGLRILIEYIDLMRVPTGRQRQFEVVLHGHGYSVVIVQKGRENIVIRGEHINSTIASPELGSKPSSTVLLFFIGLGSSGRQHTACSPA